MKTSIALFVLAVGLTLTACSGPEGHYGGPITISNRTTLAEIKADPAAFNGKEVRIEGELFEVCQKMGCYFDIGDGTEAIHVDLKMGTEWTIPKNSGGHRAVLQGRVQEDGKGPTQIIGVGIDIS